MVIISFSDTINELFKPIVRFLESVLFFDPVNATGIDLGTDNNGDMIVVPLIVICLIAGGLYFTIKYRFINVRMFPHAFALVSGKYNKKGEKGEVSHFQALTTALSATVGMGNIAGVAIAIAAGGPGATFWIMLAGFLGMSLKFAECTLGLKYRKINTLGIVSGGPMYYLDHGLKKKGLGYLGKFLAVLFALFVFLGSFGGGNMFQSHQAFKLLSSVTPFFQGKGLLVGVVLAVAVGLVIIGGIKSIARVTEKIVPFMALLYIAAAIVIIFTNVKEIDDVFMSIMREAFNINAIKGGLIGTLIIGFRRGAFSNEAGIGSAAIAHSTAQTDNPVKEGIVASIGPFIDTIMICTMTALVLIFTGYDQPGEPEGVLRTSAAFKSVINWFPYVLVVAVFLFAYSTMISWSYYGLKGFGYLFKGLFNHEKISSFIFQLLFLFFVVIGPAIDLSNVINFSDMLIFAMAFPNLIGLFILRNEVKTDLQDYVRSLKKK